MSSTQQLPLLVNNTIDDQNGDSVTGSLPSYSPDSAWSQGSTCSGCLAQPDPAKAFDGTWHDATHTPGDAESRTIDMTFNGSAVYVYCILANTVEFATTLTNLTFTLDGDEAGTFVHIPTSSTNYQFNVSVYSNSSIPYGQHTFRLEATGDQNASLVLFDYLVYSTNSSSNGSSTSATTSHSATSTKSNSATKTAGSNSTDSSSNGSSTPIGAIAGGVVGGVALIAAVLLFFFWRRRRRSRGDRILRNRGFEIDAYDKDAAARPLSPVQRPFAMPGTSAYSSSEPMPPDESTPFLGASSTQNLTIQNPSESSNDDNVFGPGYAYGAGAATASTTGHASPPAGQGSVGSGAFRPQRKVALRQEELARQVQQMQQTVATLQERGTHRPAPSLGGGVSASAPSTSSGGGSSDPDGELRNQIAVLQAEVERLQAQQEQMRNWDGNDEPPPEYHEESRDTDVRETAEEVTAKEEVH